MKENKKIIAILCALSLACTAAFTGCAKKVSYEEQTTTNSGKIKIGNEVVDVPEDAEIVVGNDGESYLVDDEGNSYVYDATSAYFVSTDLTTTTTTTKKTTKSTTKKTTSSTSKSTKDSTTEKTEKPTTESTTSEQENILGSLAKIRKQYTSTDQTNTVLSNSNVKRNYIKFESDGKEWIVELFKGRYGKSTVGCEIVIWNRDDSDDPYTLSKTISCSGKLYNSSNGVVASFATTDNGWGKGFENNNTTNGETVLFGTLTFPSTEMANAFMDALDAKEFIEGSLDDKFEASGCYCYSGGTAVEFAW